ncbi:hypothetical protein AAFF_G00259650 [Aldrovandia affinis]|uniref:Ig-like domain-containing protein n=1 Tax=Aldrovandia affinis TaxID=143900 RepID=A0AAD7W3E4_9TELE|nr:hypothetical protein AAFF_G00259650 [Aldrovandia affinis]
MFLAVLLMTLCSSGWLYRAGPVVVHCPEGRGCVIQCECRSSLAPGPFPTVAWCRIERDGSYTALARSSYPALGRVHVVVAAREGGALRALVYIRPVLQRDVGEYWCGFWTVEGNEESLYVQEKFILRVRRVQTSADDVPLPPPSSSNATEDIPTTLQSDKNIVALVAVITALVPALFFGLFIVRRNTKQNKVGNASHLDAVTLCELPVGNELVLTDVTYAVLTLHPRRVTEEGHHGNIHPDRALRRPEVVEYSAISF